MSRWSEAGGSYRTIQRFLGLPDIPWERMNWLVFKVFLQSKDDVTLIAGDEVVVTKSGKETFGVERFFSSIQRQVVPSLCFLCLSLVSVKHHRSFPVVMHQLLKKELQGCSKYRKKTIGKETDEGKKDDSSSVKRGRPKGSKNFNRRDVQLSDYLETLLGKITFLQGILGDDCKPKYLLFDGEMGNNFGVQMASKASLNLISKLRRDSQLYLPWEGEYGGRGRRKVYGERLKPQAIHDKYKVKTEEKDGSRLEYFQIEVRHKMFPDALNIVLIRKTKLSNNKVGHVILFTSDLELAWDKIVEYYSLRFQIEFNFRDAKQYWGLEDFMVIKENKVRNSASFSMFMVNISYALITNSEGKTGQSVHDLKVWFLARKQVQNTLKLCGGNAHAIFITDLIDRISMKFMINTS